MTTLAAWYTIIANFLVGTGFVLVGFKIHKPRFKSEEAEKKLYKYAWFYKGAGILLLTASLLEFLSKL